MEQKYKEQEYTMLFNSYQSLQQKQKLLIDMRLNNQISDQDFNERKGILEKESRNTKEKLDNFQKHSEQ
ncbi:MAG: hypothetical protein PHY32_04640 [Candidatus Pacebacteria bacterium]|nr:hypothetical protein [Candidatus Paceibacterota bacterium]